MWMLFVLSIVALVVGNPLKTESRILKNDFNQLNRNRNEKQEIAGSGDESYWQERKHLIDLDHGTSLGSEIKLTAKEEQVDQMLKKFLKVEMEQAFKYLQFPPSRNFLLSKNKIEESNVFKFMKEVPKGAVLHTHDTSMTSLDFVVGNITYMPHLHVCKTSGSYSFRFFRNNTSVSCTSGWRAVEEYRKEFPDFDERLTRQLSLITSNPRESYPTINDVWAKFQKYFVATSGLLSYKPAFDRYQLQAMKEMLQDKVVYYEFRGVLPEMYELDGTILNPVETIEVMKSNIDAFAAENPDFFGARFIYGPPRHTQDKEMRKYVKIMSDIKKAYPDFVAGFDLVGQEDAGYPLKYFISGIEEIAAEGIPFFFHAGETNWKGETTDENLYDAVLLNTSRIGHGYAISKHPKLLELVKQRDTPLEVCPISNQVLMLVEDLRNHPAADWVASGQPLVVSSDDPALWGSLPLSHDFYEAFMAFGGAKADLRFVKQLAMNSLKYSSLTGEKKQKLIALWKNQWDEFISLYSNSVC